MTSVLLDDRTGPGFAVIVVPAGAPDGLWTRAGYLHVGDTAEYGRLDPAPRAPAPPARAPDGLDDGSPEFRIFVRGSQQHEAAEGERATHRVVKPS